MKMHRVVLVLFFILMFHGKHYGICITDPWTGETHCVDAPPPPPPPEGDGSDNGNERTRTTSGNSDQGAAMDAWAAQKESEEKAKKAARAQQKEEKARIKRMAQEEKARKKQEEMAFAIKQEQERKEAEAAKKQAEKVIEIIRGETKLYNSQLDRLRREMNHVHVPLPQEQFYKKVHEGVVLGFMGEAPTDSGMVSPISDKVIDTSDIYQTMDKKLNNEPSIMKKGKEEGLRVFADHFRKGDHTLSTETGKELVRKIAGTHFDRLFAHSNGAVVAEALIREDIIKVEELNVMGGDRSMICTEYQDLLSSGKVKRIVVWLNPGDIVPTGTALLSGGPSDIALYCVNRAMAMNGKVEYRYLSGPQYEGAGQNISFTNMEPHFRATYFSNIKKFLTGTTPQDSAKGL
jgi:hypothetical protein